MTFCVDGIASRVEQRLTLMWYIGWLADKGISQGLIQYYRWSGILK